jgi:hypothetical protein
MSLPVGEALSVIWVLFDRWRFRRDVLIALGGDAEQIEDRDAQALTPQPTRPTRGPRRIAEVAAFVAQAGGEM